jgi:organic radical activating enzyme
MPQTLRATSTLFEPTPTGFYSYHTPDGVPNQYRLHLRVLPDETGILIVNAASILRLNQTGTYFAWLKMQGKSESEIVELSLQRYKVEGELLKDDLKRFDQEILTIVNDPDQAPLMTDTGFETSNTDQPSDMPLRVNLCLTDRWESQQSSDYDELSTEQWKDLIRKTFDAGIPQVIFIGGEPTLRTDLVELLQYTEELGMVSGLLSTSDRLYQDLGYLESLLESGLDHLILEFEPQSAQDSINLQMIFNQDLFTCVRFPVHRGSDLYAWAIGLVDAGANALSFYAADLDAHDQSAHLNQQLTNKEIMIEHDLPFPLYPASVDQPARLFSPEVSEHEYNIYTILPDGSLIRQDLPAYPLGNLLTTDWNELVGKY